MTSDREAVDSRRSDPVKCRTDHGPVGSADEGGGSAFQIGGGAVNNFDPAVKQDGKLLSEGHIALQSGSHPIEFRKVELLNLVGRMDPKASNCKSYFVKADNLRCKYKQYRER